MSLNLNTVILAGHLTRDPEVKVLAQDRSVASFGIAINRRYKGPDGEFKEDSTFIECEAWGRTAELTGQYLVKGSPCYLEGRLKLDAWQDKDGVKKQRLKVVVDNVQFLGRKPDGGGHEDKNVTHDENTSGPTVANPVKYAQPVNRRPAQVRESSGTPALAGDFDQPPF